MEATWERSVVVVVVDAWGTADIVAALEGTVVAVVAAVQDRWKGYYYLLLQRGIALGFHMDCTMDSTLPSRPIYFRAPSITLQLKGH